jgi:hypothetical protein
MAGGFVAGVLPMVWDRGQEERLLFRRKEAVKS